MTDTCEAGFIARLNDRLRRSLATPMPTGGTLVLTAGIVALGRERQCAILAAMAAFDGFGPDDDPYGEHDFGTLEAAGERVFWKIDAYDRMGRYASPDPADPSVTRRVLTVMLAGEY